MTGNYDRLQDMISRMTDEAIRTIVYDNNPDYEPYAIELAKAEWNARNKDIIDINGSDEIRLADLILHTDPDEAADVLKTQFSKRPKEIAAYRSVLNSLEKTTPAGTDDINIIFQKDLSGGWEALTIDPATNDTLDAGFCPWAQWLGYRISKDAILRLGRAFAAALCILKMTSYGLSEEEIARRFSEVQAEQPEPNDFSDIPDENDLLPQPDVSYDNFLIQIIEKRKEYLREREIPQIRPWVRFWARTIDYLIMSFIIDVIIRLLPDNPLKWLPLYISVTQMFWLPFESILLSTWGYTPGKFIMGVHVREKDGANLSLKHSFYRSFLVWLIGNGSILAPAEPILNIVSFFYLKNKQTTIWDKKGHYSVSHDRIGIPQILMAVLSALALSLLISTRW